LNLAPVVARKKHRTRRVAPNPQAINQSKRAATVPPSQPFALSGGHLRPFPAPAARFRRVISSVVPPTSFASCRSSCRLRALIVAAKDKVFGGRGGIRLALDLALPRAVFIMKGPSRRCCAWEFHSPQIDHCAE